MFIRVVYTAKLGKDRDTREAGIFTNSKGEMNLTFDKDIDWSEPVFMILEPAEGDSGYTHEALEPSDISEIPGYGDKMRAKLKEREAIFNSVMKKGEVE
jgi:hypothetical protein